MRRSVIFSISLSLILIVGALSLRIFSNNSSANLVAGGAKTEEAYVKDVFFNTAQDSSTPQENTDEPLSDTDLIGRQMILDYVALARNGEASAENLAALAEKYIDNVPNLTRAKSISYLDLNIVSNNPSNIRNYSESIEKIYKDYSSSLIGAYAKNGQISLNSQSEALMAKMGEIYGQAASRLQNMSVPGAVAEYHLSLVNLYLQNAAAMAALSQADSNPASSFAGLISLKSNVEKEREILNQIEETLKENAV